LSEPKKAAHLDLLGDPWTELKDPRGRKRHKRSPEVAEKVAVLKASGIATVDIALRVGLSEPTLRQYYFRELQNGAALAQAVLNESMWEKAKAGVVGAARYLREEFEKGQIERIATPVTPVKEAAMGKKALRQEAADQVGGRYATPEPPRLN